MTVRNILLVEDDAMTQKLVIHLLAQRPEINVISAYDTKEADLVLQTMVVDLILLDISLPGKDGLVYSLELKLRPNAAQIPIIFLTGSSNESDKEAALKLGAEEYISKPSGMNEMDAFLKKIEELLC